MGLIRAMNGMEQTLLQLKTDQQSVRSFRREPSRAQAFGSRYPMNSFVGGPFEDREWDHLATALPDIQGPGWKP